jgi:tricorn protease
MKVSPDQEAVILANHRGELLTVNLATSETKVLARSRHGRIAGFDVSSDGRYVAFGLPLSQKTAAIHIVDTQTGETHLAAESVLQDVSPSFDPEGKYLYFLSYSGFDPVRDTLDFSYGFPRGIQLKLVTLRSDLLSPFLPEPKAPGGPPGGSDGKPPGDGKEPKDEKANKDGKDEPKPVEIDFQGLSRRIVTFPVEVGNYHHVAGLPGGKVLFQSTPISGLLGRSWLPSEPDAKDQIMSFDFATGKAEPLVSGLSSFSLCPKRKVLAYMAGRRLRVISAASKPAKDEPGPPSRTNGWIDLGRPRISVDLPAEWRQMFREAWRLLRDHYYTKDMAGCDWERVLGRYAPLVDRVSTRRELSDLFWEMGGELGTSHAYELGGDYPQTRRYPQGFLGADLGVRDGSWRIEKVITGDPGGLDSPLNGPGINVEPGDEVLSVNGMELGPDFSPDEALVNLGGQDVLLALRRGPDTRTVTVRALRDEMPLRYRAWVRASTTRVHEETDGRVGYIHISDMGAQGFSEFHRAFASEVEYPALIVDVRFNAGGHVSPLILERLMRKRTGFGISRWTDPYPRPPNTVAGPMVAITDEFSGSDGDVFSHNFRQLGLGPLIGKRTWGGIVGLNPSHPLVDGTVTTQPEFFNWFFDVGYGLENHGAEPDLVVEITPQDYAAGRDPQMEKAIEVVLELLEKNPPPPPDFGPRPPRDLPT